jgi:hypothetical protein
MSSLVNQRSDLSKVASDDFLRIQQQQLANVIQKDEAEHEMATKMVESADDVRINTDQAPPRQQARDLDEREDLPPESDEIEQENVEYVVYSDPELGNSLDWRG